MADLLPRGLRAPRGNLLDSAVMSQPAASDPAAGMGEMEKGLRSSLAGQSADALTTEALKAEIAGDNAKAAEKYRQADIQRENAAAFAPRVGSLRDVHGLSDLADYAAGGLPQVLTSAAPVMAGAAAGRFIGGAGNIGRGLSAAGAMIPGYELNANESIANLVNDKEARARNTPEELLNLGRMTGVGKSALDVVGPQYILERALAKKAAQEGVKGALKTVGMAGVTEGIPEGLQELADQAALGHASRDDVTSRVDPWAIADSTALGAMGGHAMALPAAGAQLAHGAALKASREAIPLAQGAAAEVKKGGSIMLDKLRGSSPLDEVVDRAMPPEVANDFQAASQWQAQKDSDLKTAVQSRIQDVVNSPKSSGNLLDEYNKVAGDLANNDTPEGWEAAAQRLRTLDAANTTGARLKDLADEYYSTAKDYVRGLTKKNEQDSAAGKLIRNLLLTNTSPEIAKTDGFTEAVPAIHKLLAGELKGGVARRAAREFFELYGDQAMPLAEQAATVLGRDNPDYNWPRVSKALQDTLSDDMAKRRLSTASIRDNMTNEGQLALEQQLGRPLNDSDYDTLGEVMRRKVEGTLDGGDAELRQLFGQNMPKVENLFAQIHEVKSQRESRSTAREEGNVQDEDQGTSPGEASFEERQAEKNMAEPVYAKSRGQTLLMDKAYPEAIQQRIAHEEAKDPSMRYEAVPAKEAGIDSDKMVLRGVPRTDSESTEVSRRDLEGMAGDKEVVREARETKPEEGWRKTDNGRMARVGRASDGMVHMELNDGKTLSIPAHKLAYTMRGKLQRSMSEEKSRPHEAFLSGISSALEHGDVKRAYVIDKTGKEVDVTSKGALESVTLGKQTVAEHAKDAAHEDKLENARYWRQRIQPAQDLLARRPDMAEAMQRNLQAEVGKAEASGDKTAIKAARYELDKFKLSPALYLAKEWAKAREWVRGGETEEKTDTDPMLEMADKDQFEVNQRQRQYDAESKDLENTTKAQRTSRKTPSKKAQDNLAGMQAAVSGEKTEKQAPTAQQDAIKQLADQVKSSQLPHVQKQKLLAQLRDAYKAKPDAARAAYKEVRAALKMPEEKPAAEKPAAQDYDAILKKEDFGKLDTQEKVMDFARWMRSEYERLGAMSDDEIDADKAMLQKQASLMGMLSEARSYLKGQTSTDFASFFDGMEGDHDALGKQMAEILVGSKKNEQAAAGEHFTDAAEAAAYIHKALGDKIKLELVDSLGGHSGEWTKGDTVNTIKIATNAGPGLLSTAHHEAMHEFFDRLGKTGKQAAQSVLLNVANSEHVMRQLQRLLADEPAALKAIENDPEERLAYAYQFWAARKPDGARVLTVGVAGNGLFSKITKFFRKALNLLRQDERAEAILEAFHDGKLVEPSAAGRVLAGIMQNNEAAARTGDALKPLFNKAYSFVMPAVDSLTQTELSAAKEIRDMMYTPLVGGKNQKQGFVNTTRMKVAEWDSRFADIVHGLNKDEVDMLRDVMRSGKDTTFKPVQDAATKLRAELDEFHKYMTDRGVDMGYRKNYFPRVWDFEKIAKNPEQFAQFLAEKYPDKVSADAAKEIAHSMMMLSGVDQSYGTVKEAKDSVGYTPYMQAVNKLKLDFVKDEDVADYLQKDMIQIMTSYFKQGVRRAEYESRFGEGGVKLNELLSRAYDEALEKVKKENPQLSDAEVHKQALELQQRVANAAHAMEGTIGYDKITPGMRKFNSWMIVYQNLRLLPLVLFSSQIDPLGFIVRGSDLNHALEGYKRGVQEVLATWTGKELIDNKTKMAEMLGVIEHQSFLDTLGYVQESMYMDPRAKKFSDTFFRYNGMEGWNRGMRIQAMVAAIDFIKEHASNPGEHSARWLEELGLTKNDVKFNKDGSPALFKEDFMAHGMDEAAAQKAADKMQFAVNQWVDGAMLRPNAALRPAWASDPRWALLFYLKQFTYAFQKTFLARVRNEYKHGNMAPMVAMLPFVPVMIAADVMRGLIQTGGELPTYMKGWGVGDYLIHGVQRAGLTGVAQFGLDEPAHPLGITGPVVEQAVSAFNSPVGDTVRNAIPGLAVANVMPD